MIKLGNVISTVATPVARALHMPCIDPETNQLYPESGCAKRKQRLNDFSDAMYDSFWPQQKEEE